MNELTLDGKTYVSSKRAAELTGYAKDYVGQLCREGRVEARLVGRNWYVLKDAINDRKFEAPGTTAVKTTEADPSKERPEEALAASSLGEVRYEAQESIDFPSINRLAETRQNNEENTDLNSLQSSWSTWFSEAEESQKPEDNGVVEDKEAEKVTLRRIREYKPATIATKQDFFEEKIEKNPKTHVKRASSGLSSMVLRGVFVVLALFAIGIGFAGSSFYTPIENLPHQLNFIAGAGFYTKAQ